MMNAIPTLYLDVQFRSRLEARWAAMFDELHWPWRYEPVDFDGWIPDFALLFETGTVYVEVKPFLDVAANLRRDLAPVIQKIDNSGCEDDVLLVGAAGAWPWMFGECIGLLKEWSPKGYDYGWGSALLERCGNWNCPTTYRLGFHHVAVDDRNRACGCDMYADHYNSNDSSGVFNEMWSRAGNAVQWRKAAR